MAVQQQIEQARKEGAREAYPYLEREDALAALEYAVAAAQVRELSPA